MKNYFKRLLFGIGMILSNIIKLIFGIVGLAFFFAFSTMTYLLVIFGWYNNIEGRTVKAKDFNFLNAITFQYKLFN